MTSHEAAGGQLIPAIRKNLPNRILRAFDSAMHLKGLPRGARDTLAELCRFVPQNLPFQTIFAFKATIAERIGMSERSMYRHLGTLLARGLIEVLEQDRKSRNGRFTGARIRLTRLAAALLGLIEAPELIEAMEPTEGATKAPSPHVPCPATPPPVPAAVDGAPAPSPAVLAEPHQHISAIGKVHGDKVSLAVASQALAGVGQLDETILKAPCSTTPASVIHRSPSAKLADGHTLSEPTISKHQPSTRTENGVPADLAWLSSSGMSRPGIFKLMGMAKARDKLLSDIVIAVRERLHDMKGGRLYAYLAKLVAGPSDFAAAAAVERKRIADAREAGVYARKARAFKERFRNCALTNRKQNRLYVIDRDAAFVQVLGGSYPASSPLNDLRDWIEQIENGMLVLATLEVERRFQA